MDTFIGEEVHQHVRWRGEAELDNALHLRRGSSFPVRVHLLELVGCDSLGFASKRYA